MAFLGKHAIFDINLDIDHPHLKDIPAMMGLMRQVVLDQGATIIREESHQFGAGGGYSFTIILSESHATCHTWPEHGMATFDIYMCGEHCDPYKAMDNFVETLRKDDILRNVFETKVNRGWVNEEALQDT